MSKFYIKNKEGRFIPIELKSILNKDLNNKLAIVRVGTDKVPATMEDVEITEESFRQAEVLDSINLSIIKIIFITFIQFNIKPVKNSIRKNIF